VGPVQLPELFAFELATPTVSGSSLFGRDGLDFQDLESANQLAGAQIRDAFALEGDDTQQRLSEARSIGDINGDGLADVLVEGDDSAYILFGPVELDGLTSIGAAADIVIDTDSVGLVADRLDDIDGDGLTDLVFKQVDLGNLTVTMVLSDGFFGAVTEDVEFLPRNLDAGWINSIQSRANQDRVLTITIDQVVTRQDASVNALRFDGDANADLFIVARKTGVLTSYLYSGSDLIDAA
jgi:hypothetical protein